MKESIAHGFLKNVSKGRFKAKKKRRRRKKQQRTILPGARVVAQLVHMWVVLGHDGDGVTLLSNDETSLLLCSIPQVDTVELIKRKRYSNRENDEVKGCDTEAECVSRLLRALND